MTKIVITTSSFAQNGSEALMHIPKDFELVMNPHGRPLKADELVTLASDANGIIAGTEKYDAPTIAQLKKLRVLSRVGVGMDNIDLAAAKARGIKVFNTPDGPTQAVAELVIGLSISLLRKTFLMDRELRQGHWKKEMGSLLAGKRIGIIGMGRIGCRVAQLFRAFNAQIAFYEIAPALKRGDCEMKALPDLLKWSDIISLHCSAKEQLLGASEISLMKKGAWIINTARGTLIHEAALVEALQSDHLAGAAIDVFAQEPYSGPLTALPNVIIVPHIGSYAKECRIQMETDAVTNLLEGLRA